MALFFLYFSQKKSKNSEKIVSFNYRIHDFLNIYGLYKATIDFVFNKTMKIPRKV